MLAAGRFNWKARDATGVSAVRKALLTDLSVAAGPAWQSNVYWCDPAVIPILTALINNKYPFK